MTRFSNTLGAAVWAPLLTLGILATPLAFADVGSRL